ncbi:BatD family protein [Algicella marina]|uniref:Protein BatD n=1 Tax=Algicella marina TaxID=2683284 RepID=A0A6P1T479_9RHOB|nr:BatD family protein [Algicella marina]QHQ36510.1 hypothetical protein GO499_15680 [Algicella marina]
MVRVFAALLFLLLPGIALAQTEVDPEDFSLTVTLDQQNVTPFQQEMVLITIHGTYRRHITREKLVMPDLAGFNWMQLGSDHWYESMVDGLPVKNMRRRMALFPDEEGKIEIGSFTHHLTLLDDNNNWFEYDIHSEPVQLDVAPAPAVEDWWFPVRRLQISDSWSNAPDQLGEGDGVLRIITVIAVGASPDMIPPMPELRSPSAHIFPHPEKRLVELSPHGPVSRAFWRWTIRPANPPSAILEPITFSYFDTENRLMRDVVISSQRVAYAEGELPPPGAVASAEPVNLAALPVRAALFLAVIGGFLLVLGQGRVLSFAAPRQMAADCHRQLAYRRAVAAGNLPSLRRAARELSARRPANEERFELLRKLDSALFAERDTGFDLKAFDKSFRASLAGGESAKAFDFRDFPRSKTKSFG